MSRQNWARTVVAALTVIVQFCSNAQVDTVEYPQKPAKLKPSVVAAVSVTVVPQATSTLQPDGDVYGLQLVSPPPETEALSGFGGNGAGRTLPTTVSLQV